MSEVSETINPTALRVIKTARQLFMQRGYRAVSINDIVGAAEITKPTLYYHFADKEELFVQMVLHVLHEMRTEMDRAIAPHHDTQSRLTALTHMMLEMPNSDSRMIRQETREHLSLHQQARIGEAFHQHMFLPVRSIMATGLAHGELHGHSADELAMLFLCFLEGFHYQHEHRTPNNPPVPEMPFSAITFSPQSLVQVFMHGVGQSVVG
jgi:AcrR family transcriptional regulator